MHSFLSKVFGRKKDDKDVSPTQLSPGELLGERFEAISPNVSPSATKFLELDPKVNSVGESSQDTGFSLFRAKSRPSSPETKSKRHDTLPQLSLAFLEASGLRSPAGDFLREADPDMSVLLSDAIIGQRRLNPLEALVLIRACSQAIIARGLETLGVMHPHWYSASPDVQRRLISQFINSLNVDSTTSPTSSSPTTAFESEMTFMRPHDVAAVLRWGLRHLQLDGDQLGKDETWYTKFLESEASVDYPLKAFSEQLAPHLPPAHLEVLTSTLEIFSSLAAHAEANSTSGSKLSKIFGLWLLVSQRVDSKDDFHAFYQRWERMGRMLEHLFLARIRDDSADRRMPVRLLELVRQYPYTKGLSNPMTDVKLLARPRITTIPYDALFVRLEVELPSEMRRPKHKINPLTLLADAFSLQVEGEYAELWTIITSESKHGSSPSPLSNVFADETIRFLSMVPGMDAAEAPVKSPSLSIFAGGMLSAHRRSATAIEKGKGKPAPTVVSGHVKPATDPTPVSALSPLDLTQDWDQFSTSGFFEVSPAIIPLASTLLDNDVEKTVPPDPPVSASLSRSISRRSSKSKHSRHAKSPSSTSPRKSEETIRPTPVAPTPPPPQQDALTLTKASKVQIIQIDEAFVDFWSDALLDPISSDWPTFIICKFKTSLLPKLVIGIPEEGQTAKALKYLILEHIHTIKPPLPPTPVEVARPRASSPSSESMSPKKRFSFWSMNRSLSGSSVGSPKGKNKVKSPVAVGEMGELLEEGNGSSSSSKSPISRIRQSLDISRKPSESPTLKKAESMAAIKESAPFASGVAVVGVVSAIVPNEGNKDESEIPQTQEIVEEAKQEEVAKQGAISSADNAALSQDEQAVVISNAEQSPSSGETPTVEVPESSVEVSEQSGANEKHGVLVSSVEIPVILDETYVPEQEDTAVDHEPTPNGGNILEPPMSSAEVANTPDSNQESIAESATQESVQIDTSLQSQADEQHLASSQDQDLVSDINTLEEEQVEVVEDGEQKPPLILTSVEEATLAENIATPVNEESVSPLDDESDVMSTSNLNVEQVNVEPVKEDVPSPDSTLDESLNTDPVDDTSGYLFKSKDDAIPPTEEGLAVDDVNSAAEKHDVDSLDELTQPQVEDQADSANNAETLVVDADLADFTEPESIVELQHIDREAVVTQMSFAEHVMQELAQVDAVQERSKSLQQDLPLIEEVTAADISGVTRIESLQGIETHTPPSDAEFINNNGPPSVFTATEGTEANVDTREITEDIPFTEASSSEETKEDVEPPSIVETVDEAEISIEEESTPVHSDEVDIVPEPEHQEIAELVQATSAESPTAVPLEETHQAQDDTTADGETFGEAEPVLMGNLEAEDTAPEVHHRDTQVVLPQELFAESATQGLTEADAVQSSDASEQDSHLIAQAEEANTESATETAHVQDTEPYVPSSLDEHVDKNPLVADATEEHTQITETLSSEENSNDTESLVIPKNFDDAKSTIEEVSAPIHTDHVDTVPEPEHNGTVDLMEVTPVGLSSVVVLEETSQAEVQAQQDTDSGNEASGNLTTLVVTDSAEIESAHETHQEASTEHGAQENDRTEAPPLECPEQHEPPGMKYDQVEIPQEGEQPLILDISTEEQSFVPSAEEQPLETHDDQVVNIPESAPNVEEDSEEQLKGDVAEVDIKLTTDPKDNDPPFSDEANDGRLLVENDEGVPDANPAGMHVTLIDPTQPEDEVQEDAVAGYEGSTNVVVTADPLPIAPAEISSADELPSVEVPMDIQTKVPTEQYIEAHMEGVLNDIQPPHIPALLDHDNSDPVKQDTEPRLEEVSAQVDADPTPVLDVQHAADESSEKSMSSSGAVSSEHEQTKDVAVNAATSSPEFNDQTTHVEEDEVLDNSTEANAVEALADSDMDKNPQSQAPDEGDDARGSTPSDTSQVENIQESSTGHVVEIDARPLSEMTEEDKETRDVDISAEHHPETTPAAMQPVEEIEILEESTPEALAELSTTTHPEEHTSVHDDLAVISNPDSAVEQLVDQQLTEETVVGGSVNDPIETVPEQSLGVPGEMVPLEMHEDAADRKPIAPPVNGTLDEAPAAQYPQQEETAVSPGINEAEVINPITSRGAESESSADEPLQVKKETVLQELQDESLVYETAQGENLQDPEAHTTTNQTELENNEELSPGVSAKEPIESILDTQDNSDTVQIAETWPSEDNKGNVESAAIVESHEQVNSLTEIESASPEIQAQEDIAGDNKTSSSLMDPVVVGSAETESVTQTHHIDAEAAISQEPSTEPAISDALHVSIVQPASEEPEQDLVPTQERDEGTLSSAEATKVEVPQHIEQHTFDTGAEPVNNEGSSSEMEVTRAKEVSEDVHVALPIEESMGDAESSAILENIVEVISPLEEKSEPVQAVMVSGFEHKNPEQLTNDNSAESTVDTVLEEAFEPQIQAQVESAPEDEIPSVTPVATAGAEVDAASDVLQEDSNTRDIVQIDTAPLSEIPEPQGMGDDPLHNEGKIDNTHEPLIPVVRDGAQSDIVIEQVAEEQTGESHIDDETVQPGAAALLGVTAPTVPSCEQRSESGDNDGAAESTQVDSDTAPTPTHLDELSTNEHAHDEVNVEETPAIPIVSSQFQFEALSSASPASFPSPKTETIATPVIETPVQEIVEPMADTPQLVHHKEAPVDMVDGDDAAHEAEPHNLTPDQLPLEMGPLEADSGAERGIAESGKTLAETIPVSAMRDFADDVVETPVIGEEDQDPNGDTSKTALHDIRVPIVTDDGDAGPGMCTEVELDTNSSEIKAEA